MQDSRRPSAETRGSLQMSLLIPPRHPRLISARPVVKFQRPCFDPTRPPHRRSQTKTTQTMSKRALRLAALLLAAVAVAATPAAVAARVGPPLAGGWSPIKDVSDPHIQELGGWAVAEHARLANDGLRFGEVTGGEQQVVAGMNYKLVLDATDADGAVGAYGAFVYEQAWTNTRELMSFAPASR
ncbi:hypothetical protein GQ55_9G428300 [Panicum hallii var. hallii]|uniref:Cystatin domain-containing protein n=1 Tax=Panicum hallii var. hallii TaxID=1504633 RepID=A0A2T7CAY0_9POAL|nr:hypothetical protein GQ55_9G428300 [Panicum hallii var. hallii]